MIGIGLAADAWRRRPPLAAELATVSYAAAAGIDAGLKRAFERPRPPLADPAIHPLVRLPHSSSMPSGHAATAFAAAVAVGLVHPRLRWPLLALASLIAVSRVWLGVHYPSDVIVGAGVGAAATFAIWRLLQAASAGLPLAPLAPPPSVSRSQAGGAGSPTGSCRPLAAPPRPAPRSAPAPPLEAHDTLRRRRDPPAGVPQERRSSLPEGSGLDLPPRVTSSGSSRTRGCVVGRRPSATDAIVDRAARGLRGSGKRSLESAADGVGARRCSRRMEAASGPAGRRRSALVRRDRLSPTLPGVPAPNAGATLAPVLATAPPPTIPSAVKSVYPRSPVRVVRTCRVDGGALVRLRVAGAESFVVLERVPRGWRVVWVDGRVARSVSASRRAGVAVQAARLRTRCLAP